MIGKSMEGKVAVITGAGRGIGRDVALSMAAQGAKVVVNDIGASVAGEGADATPGQQVVDEIRAAGGEAVASIDSVSEWASAQRIVGAALETFGRIDVVVNNAGILRDRFIFKMSPEEWHAVLSVHLHGSFYVSRAAAEHFKAQGSGAYVHMTSTSGLLGNFGQANYGAAKAGIAALSRAIAFDMQRYHVRSNCVAPFAWSRMGGTIKADSPEKQAWLDKGKAALQPSKIAPMIVFLASDLAHDVTGQVFAARGNEIFLMSQPRPVRGMQCSDGWTPQSIAERVIPAVRSSFTPLENSSVVFSWDPV
jgi:NAD(P)-dependent dehydrogenase (short-subunit alcohol dehydrogenase family)